MMIRLFMTFCLVLAATGCGKDDEVEIYNENNTNVVNGIVYDIDEKPINGVYKTYHSNGSVKMEMMARGGLPHGEGKVYDENGNLQYSGTFEQGKINGKLYQYYEDGNIHNELNYINGLQDGPQRLYDNKGQVAAEIVYDNGEVVSGYVNLEGEKIEIEEDELEKLIAESEDIEKNLKISSTDNGEDEGAENKED